VAKSKGTEIVTLRKIVHARGEPFAASFRDALTPGSRQVFDGVTAMSWVPVEDFSRLLAETAAALFPGEKDGLQRLGQAIARDNLTGIYKILLKVTTVPFVLTQVSKLWTTYNDTGKARVLQDGRPHRAEIIVEEFPGLPLPLAAETAGFMAGACEVCGGQGVRVEYDSPSPSTHRWTCTWD
jgi:hypothetical protein